jgi:hypothetical protein
MSTSVAAVRSAENRGESKEGGGSLKGERKWRKRCREGGTEKKDRYSARER